MVDQNSTFREFLAFTTFYPFKATDLFFGVYHNLPVNINLTVDIPYGYKLLTSAMNFSSEFRGNSRLNELVAVIMKGFAVRMLNNNKLRLVSDQFYNKTFDESYEPFAYVAMKTHSSLNEYFGQKLPGVMTVGIVPFLNVRPMVFGAGICLVDSDIATTEIFNMKMYMIMCMIHQHMSRLWTGALPNFYYMFEGLRDLYTLLEMSTGYRLLMQYYVNVLHRDDQFMTATTVARVDGGFYSRSDVAEKSETH